MPGAPTIPGIALVPSPGVRPGGRECSATTWIDVDETATSANGEPLLPRGNRPSIDAGHRHRVMPNRSDSGARRNAERRPMATVNIG
jgi:hypothetical protein